MNKYYLAMLCVMTGCSSLPKVPEKILIPVSTPCIKELPTRPQFATKDYLKNLSNPDYVTELTSEYLKQGNYINVLESLLLACK